MSRPLSVALLLLWGAGCAHRAGPLPEVVPLDARRLADVTASESLTGLDLHAVAVLVEAGAPELLAARAEAGVADAAVVTARQRANPTLDVELAMFPLIPKVTLGLPLSGPGRRAARVARARALSAAADAELHSEAWRVWAEGAHALVDQVAAGERIGLLTRASAAQEEALSLIEGRISAGRLPSTARLPAQQAQVATRLELGGAQQDEILARVELARVIGLPAAELERLPVRIRLDDALLGSATATSPVLTERADVKAAALRLEAAGHAVREAARGRLGESWLGASGEWDPSGTIWTPTLSTELPLFHAGGGPVAEAVAGYDAAAAALLAVQADARAELDGVSQRLSLARTRLEDVEDALREAEQAEAAADARLSAGAGDPLERLDAVVAATTWRLARVELRAALRHAEIDALAAARATELRQALPAGG